jgi:hypothetical protein
VTKCDPSSRQRPLQNRLGQAVDFEKDDPRLVRRRRAAIARFQGAGDELIVARFVVERKEGADRGRNDRQQQRDEDCRPEVGDADAGQAEPFADPRRQHHQQAGEGDAQDREDDGVDARRQLVENRPGDRLDEGERDRQPERRPDAAEGEAGQHPGQQPERDGMDRHGDQRPANEAAHRAKVLLWARDGETARRQAGWPPP